MENILIKDLYRNTEKYLDNEVQISGWVKTVRDSKNFGFIEVNDGSFFKNVQVVFTDSLSNFEDVRKLTISSSIIVMGKLVKTENAKQPFEIQATTVEVFNVGAADYPLQKKRHTFEYLRTISHLRARTNTFNAVFRVRSVLSFAIHKFFNERGFVYVHTPIITSSDAEGAGEMFTVTSADLNDLPKDEKGLIEKWILTAIEGKLNQENDRVQEFRTLAYKLIQSYRENETKLHRKEVMEVYFQDAEIIKKQITVYEEAEQALIEQKNQIAVFIFTIDTIFEDLEQKLFLRRKEEEELLYQLRKLEQEEFSYQIYQYDI